MHMFARPAGILGSTAQQLDSNSVAGQQQCSRTATVWQRCTMPSTSGSGSSWVGQVCVWQRITWPQSNMGSAAHHMATERHVCSSASHGHRAPWVQQRITWPQSVMGAAAHHMAPERHGCGSASCGPRVSWGDARTDGPLFQL